MGRWWLQHITNMDWNGGEMKWLVHTPRRGHVSSCRKYVQKPNCQVPARSWFPPVPRQEVTWKAPWNQLARCTVANPMRRISSKLEGGEISLISYLEPGACGKPLSPFFMNPHLGCVRKAPISRKHWGMPYCWIYYMIQYLWESRANPGRRCGDEPVLKLPAAQTPRNIGDSWWCARTFFDLQIYGAFFGCLSWQRSN